jgi:hypothetical protein
MRARPSSTSSSKPFPSECPLITALTRSHIELLVQADMIGGDNDFLFSLDPLT